MKHAWLCALALASFSALAWSAPKTTATPGINYNPQALFAPFQYRHPVNRYRSADGRPGPDYWPNPADYEIQATLDPKARTLTGTETITYTNNSPEPLDYLWLQLDQNRYRSDARGNFASGRAAKPDEHTDGDVITTVQVESGNGKAAAHYLVSDTRMRKISPSDHLLQGRVWPDAAARPDSRPRTLRPAFKQYVRDWAFKHPSPSDFFRTMDSAAGEDLSWFCRGWFQQN